MEYQKIQRAKVLPLELFVEALAVILWRQPKDMEYIGHKIMRCPEKGQLM